MIQVYAVLAIIFHPSNDGRVLAISRRGVPRDLGLPGGKVEPTDDTLEMAVGREVLEESGVLVDVSQLHPVFERMGRSGLPIRTFVCTRWHGDPYEKEPGCVVAWAWPHEMTSSECSFGSYNQAVFDLLAKDGWLSRQIAQGVGGSGVGGSRGVGGSL